MLSTDDFKKLLQLFPTKEELRQELEKNREEMATKDDFRRAMTILDQVLKEVLAMRQEQTFHVQSHEDIKQDLSAIKKHISFPQAH